MAKFRFDCPLRWSDMDAFGHVNNVKFLTYYEEARVAMVFNAAKEHGLDTFARGVVVARHEVDYLRPLSVTGDPVRVDVWVDEVRNSSFTLAYELVAGQDAVSRAKTVMVPFDVTAGRSRRVTDSEREFLEAWRA